jgi:hypothetical protein
MGEEIPSTNIQPARSRQRPERAQALSGQSTKTRLKLTTLAAAVSLSLPLRPPLFGFFSAFFASLRFNTIHNLALTIHLQLWLELRRAVSIRG